MKFKVTQDTQFIQLIQASEKELNQLHLSLSKKIENAKWRTKKTPYWDGTIKFIDKNNRVPFGLWDKLYEIAEKYKFEIEIEGLERVINFDFDENEYLEWEKEFFKNSPKKPRDIQTKAVIETLKFKRCISEIATSAGKTLIIFCMFAYLKQKGFINKMLLVVPSNDLVSQCMEDFEEFSQDRTLIKYKIQPIGGGNSKIKQDVDFVVGTFQTLRNMETDFYEGINVTAIDECLHPDSLITMSDNSKKKISEIEIGEIIKTVNEKTLKIENKEVEFVYKNLSKKEKMYELELEDGTILKVTGNHKILLKNNKWKRADELSEHDDIFCYDFNI